MTVPDSALTRDEIIARNLKVVEAHFHNETPEHVEKAVALYGDTISWEAPTRGVVMNDKDEILKAYRAIFRTIAYRRVVPLRRFATDKFVFDDQIGHVTVVGNEMPNIPYPVGAELAVRLVHLFEMKDGKIVREIAYEMWRKEGAPNAVDFVPPGTKVITFAPPGAAAANAVDIDALLKANIARVFNERDPDCRRAALGELYTEDATLYDPEAVATGREAISAAVDNLLLNLPPNFAFTAAGNAVGHNGAARVFWRAGPPDGSVAITGTDVAHIEDGRIKYLYVFVDPVAR